jgi:hypothetical protein
MRKLLILLTISLFPLCLRAQNTIGDSKEDIRKLIQSNPNFKLLAGNDCDTLVFNQGMLAIFDYKNNTCYKSISVLPLKYMSVIIEKMTTDFYKKIDDNTWIDSKKTLRVKIVVDNIKSVCLVTTTAYDK